jgi:hypothetical protein
MATYSFVPDRVQNGHCSPMSTGNRQQDTLNSLTQLPSRPDGDVAVVPPLPPYELALVRSEPEDRGRPLPVAHSDMTVAEDGIRAWRSGQRRHSVWPRPSHAGAHPHVDHQLRIISLDGGQDQPSKFQAPFLNLHPAIKIPGLKFHTAGPECDRLALSATSSRVKLHHG